MTDPPEIEELIAELSRTIAERDSTDAGAAAGGSELRALLDRQIAILEDTIEMRRALDRISIHVQLARPRDASPPTARRSSYRDGGAWAERAVAQPIQACVSCGASRWVSTSRDI
jgi:hypothetical protein